MIKITNFVRLTQNRWAKRLFIVGLGLLAVLGINTFTFAQKTPVVYVAPIEGIIDLGLAPFVQRVLDEANDAGAAAVILEINTFGGRLDAAVLIRDALLNARVRTVAFVNKRAISAGALIALAAEKIVMADGGTIGAATPVQIGQPGSARATGGGENRILRAQRVSRDRRKPQAPPAHRRGDGRRGCGNPRPHPKRQAPDFDD